MNDPVHYRGLPRVHDGDKFELEPIHKLIDAYDVASMCTGSFVVSGHSLGGGMANIFTAASNVPVVTCDNFKRRSDCVKADSCEWRSLCRTKDGATMSPAVKNSKYVDFLFTYGSVRPSWTSPLTNFRARDGVFAGARHVKAKEMLDGGLVSDPAPLWPPAGMVSSFPSLCFCFASPLHLASI